MTEDRFEDMLGDLASDYNAPPAVPREEMWQRIQAARAAEAEARAGSANVVAFPVHRRGLPAWTAWGLGLAAMLLIGIGIGRLTRVEQTGRGAVASTGPKQATSPVANPDSGPAVLPGQVAAAGSQAGDTVSAAALSGSMTGASPNGSGVQ